MGKQKIAVKKGNSKTNLREQGNNIVMTISTNFPSDNSFKSEYDCISSIPNDSEWEKSNYGYFFPEKEFSETKNHKSNSVAAITRNQARKMIDQPLNKLDNRLDDKKNISTKKNTVQSRKSPRLNTHLPSPPYMGQDEPPITNYKGLPEISQSTEKSNPLNSGESRPVDTETPTVGNAVENATNPQGSGVDNSPVVKESGLQDEAISDQDRDKLLDHRARSANNNLTEAMIPVEKGKNSKLFISDHWRVHKALANLLFVRTRREMLIRDQKRELKEIMDNCLKNKDFTYETKGGKYQLKEMLLFFDQPGQDSKVVLPPSLYGLVIATYHLLQLHGGVEKINFALAPYYIPGLNKLIRLYISTCYICLVNNSVKHTKIGHIPLVRPGYVIHVDLIESLNENYKKRHILLCVDPFSKFLFAHPIEKKTTVEVLPFLLNTVFQVFNVKILISDGGGLFVSKEFKEALKKICVKHITVSAFHPQSNGIAESYVRRVKTLLRKLMTLDDTEDWLSILPLVVKSLNTQKVSDFSATPLELIYGPGNANAYHALTDPNVECDLPPVPMATDTKKAMNNFLKEYKREAENKSLKRKARLNKNRPLPKINVGDYVLLKDFSILPGINRTLHSRYRLEIYRVNRVKSRSVIATSMATFTPKLIAMANLKVINIENHKELNIPENLSKLLLKDTQNLTFEDQVTIAKRLPAQFLPEPTPEVLEDFSDDDESFVLEEDLKPEKKVTFDLNPNIFEDDTQQE